MLGMDNGGKGESDGEVTDAAVNGAMRLDTKVGIGWMWAPFIRCPSKKLRLSSERTVNRS